MRKLFRQEAIDAQREKLLGEVSLARPVPLWAFTLTALAFTAAVVVFSVWGQYARRERVEGYLNFDGGIARIQLPEAGLISDLLVKEGDNVAAGAPLAKLNFEKSTGTGLSSAKLVENEYTGRLAMLESEQEQARSLGAQQITQTRRKIDDLGREIGQIDVEIQVQQTRLASARQEFQNADQLYREKFYSESKLIEFRNSVLDQQSKLEGLRRQRTGLQRELSNAQTDLPQIDLKTRAVVDQLKRQSSELQQGLVQEEAKRENVLRAPIAGVVTNIALSRGQSFAPDTPFATILPHGTRLRAELLVPTRAVGFVKPGDEVVMRYDAFPFQRFGQYRGTVESVSQTVWSPGERVGAMTVREPVYRVDVKLDQQAVMVNGQALALRSGMVLSADILLEKRSVLEWVFEPILGLRERLK